MRKLASNTMGSRCVFVGGWAQRMKGRGFDGDDCTGVVTTDAHVWPRIISMQIASPDMNPNDRIQPVDFTADYDSEGELRPTLLRIGRKILHECTIWTCTRVSLRLGKHIPSLLTRKALLYTMVSAIAVPFLLNSFWKSAEEVNVDPNCQAKTRGQR